MRTVFSTHVFPTSAENMQWDVLQLSSAEKRHLRAYMWPSPGITYPEKHDLEVELKGFDSASRITGGGVVLHGEGDVVFSCVATLNDPAFPPKIKDKLSFFTQLFSHVLSDFGIQADAKEGCVSHSHAFCAAYDSPYELCVRGHKVMGLSARKWKTQFMVQGILHRAPTIASFGNLPAQYHPYFTQGIGTEVSGYALIDALREAVLK